MATVKKSAATRTSKKPTRSSILQVAANLFALEGYSAVSIRAIARRVGIKEGSIYRHFASKKQIFNEIIEDFGTRFWGDEPQRVTIDQMLEASSPKEILRNGLQFFKRQMGAEDMGMIWRILAVEQYRNKKARALVQSVLTERTIGFLQMLFKAFADRNLIRPLDPALLAAEYQNPLFYLMSEYCLRKHVGEETREVESQMENHVEFFWSIVSSPPAQ
jgi:AcrR family transcriptional regulator